MAAWAESATKTIWSKIFGPYEMFYCYTGVNFSVYVDYYVFPAKANNTWKLIFSTLLFKELYSVRGKLNVKFLLNNSNYTEQDILKGQPAVWTQGRTVLFTFWKTFKHQMDLTV